MPTETITDLEIENYGCIQKASFKLSPLHALIGPNDSGKSTVLKALRTGSLRLLKQGGDEIKQDPTTAIGINGVFLDKSNEWTFHTESAPSVVANMALPTLIRFDPNFLRLPSNLIGEDQSLMFQDECGRGLPGVLDAIQNRNVDQFLTIAEATRNLFPTVAKLGLTNRDGSVILTTGQRVQVSEMSDGLLYFLAFQALKHLGGNRLFLVEEPENGLHPARIVEVMKILREVSKTSQVLIATHSPLVVNELEGHEVSVVTRDPETGTQAILLKDVPGFDRAMKVYQPGEFWLSYCDGEQEKSLLTGTAHGSQ